MKNIKKKVKTLQLLVISSKKIVDPTVRSNIIDDFDELERCISLKPDRRRRLLNTLHAARGLEGAIIQVIAYHSIPVIPKWRSLGGYLWALHTASPPIISSRMRSDCQHYVVHLRNSVAHNTGYYPAGNLEVDRALDRITQCLSLILI